jgi:hypothetical protein
MSRRAALRLIAPATLRAGPYAVASAGDRGQRPVVQSPLRHLFALRSIRTPVRAAWLFAYDWDRSALQRVGAQGGVHFDRAGFDLFSFPSNLALARFDMDAFVQRQVRRGRARGWRGVLSHHEQFGALAAALVAEQLGLPGARPESIIAAQHKLHARRVLAHVAPEASLPVQSVEVGRGETLPADLALPAYVKPVKAAFSVLARRVDSHADLAQHLSFSGYERWLLQRLVEPFEQARRLRLPEAGSAHRVFLEAPVPPATPQFNLDGWVFDGAAHALGVVDAVMVPGTQAFLRWEVPSRLPPAVQARAFDVARRFLAAIGYRHGFFNLEFFYDAASDQLTVIECNPRLASQFGDLHARVDGFDAHAMSVALALGEDPMSVPRAAPTAQVAASLVYRAFPGEVVPRQPRRAQRAALAQTYPDALLLPFPKRGAGVARDFRWTGSHRYGIVHLGAADWDALRTAAEHASALIGWPAPFMDEPAGQRAADVRHDHAAPGAWPDAVPAT